MRNEWGVVHTGPEVKIEDVRMAHVCHECAMYKMSAPAVGKGKPVRPDVGIGDPDAPATRADACRAKVAAMLE